MGMAAVAVVVMVAAVLAEEEGRGLGGRRPAVVQYCALGTAHPERSTWCTPIHHNGSTPFL